MSTFWKIFAIFWIIFLVWYLTGGPQRVTLNGATPTTTLESNNNPLDNQSAGAPDMSSFFGGSPDPQAQAQAQSQEQSDKSFSDKPKTNTINVAN